jgi:hypothetical protein
MVFSFLVFGPDYAVFAFMVFRHSEEKDAGENELNNIVRTLHSIVHAPLDLFVAVQIRFGLVELWFRTTTGSLQFFILTASNLL